MRREEREGRKEEGGEGGMREEGWKERGGQREEGGVKGAACSFLSV